MNIPEGLVMLFVATDGCLHVVSGNANGGSTCLRCLTEAESLQLANAIYTGTGRLVSAPHSEARH